MRAAAVLSASVVLIGLYLLVAAAFAFGMAATGIGVLTIAAAGALVAMAATPGGANALRA